MICYFRESLKPFIKVKMEQQDRKSMDFQEMAQKIVNAEAKIGLRSSIIVRDSDPHCPRGHRPSHNTSSTVQIQDSSHKNLSHIKKPKNKVLKSTPPCGNMAEPVKKEDKKKRPQKRRQKQSKQTLATGDNTKALKKKKKRRNSSKITYLYCDKKGHYASDYTKPPKN